jgi:uncharacterized membrane protein (Fun14 family)
MILYFLGMIIGLVIGWYACKHYYMVKKMGLLIDVFTELMTGVITVEQAMDKMKELDDL